MLLAEDLLLLLTDDESGKHIVAGNSLDFGLGGAQLLELSMRGALDVDERGRLVVQPLQPSGDEVLDQGWQAAYDKNGKKPQRVVGPLGKGLADVLYARMAADGVLREERAHVMGLFPTTRWPSQSRGHEESLLRGIEASLAAGQATDPHTGALVSLLHSLKVLGKVVDRHSLGLGRRELDQRAKAIAEGDWASEAVRKAVAAANAAVAAAITASTASAASAGSS